MINVIADRYAQALFEVGEETQTTSELYQELSELVDIFNENKDINTTTSGRGLRIVKHLVDELEINNNEISAKIKCETDDV